MGRRCGGVALTVPPTCSGLVARQEPVSTSGEEAGAPAPEAGEMSSASPHMCGPEMERTDLRVRVREQREEVRGFFLTFCGGGRRLL